MCCATGALYLQRSAATSSSWTFRGIQRSTAFLSEFQLQRSDRQCSAAPKSQATHVFLSWTSTSQVPFAIFSIKCKCCVVPFGSGASCELWYTIRKARHISWSRAPNPHLTGRFKSSTQKAHALQHIFRTSRTSSNWCSWSGPHLPSPSAFTVQLQEHSQQLSFPV